MRTEIEVKAWVRNREAVREALAAKGCVLSAPITQDDHVFRHKDALDTHGEGVIVLRIRRTGATAYFTLKQNRSNELDCIEQETEVSNPDAMEEALKIMGYQKIARVKKTREKGMCGDYEICLDVVEGLGDFIEVEQMTDGGDGVKIQEELFLFLKELGIAEEDMVMQGYDTLIEAQSKK